MNKSKARAQLTVVGLMMVFLTVMVMASLMPTMIDKSQDMGDNLTTEGLDTEATLVELIPMFLIVVFLATLALYGSPQ